MKDRQHAISAVLWLAKNGVSIDWAYLLILLDARPDEMEFTGTNQVADDFIQTNNGMTPGCLKTKFAMWFATLI